MYDNDLFWSNIRNVNPKISSLTATNSRIYSRKSERLLYNDEDDCVLHLC